MTTTEDKTYNGWSNYETWAVNLWIGNEQRSQDYWQTIANDLYVAAEAGEVFTKREQAIFDIAARLKDEFEQGAEEALGGKATVYADLLNAAVSEVNWREIAEHLLPDDR